MHLNFLIDKLHKAVPVLFRCPKSSLDFVQFVSRYVVNTLFDSNIVRIRVSKGGFQIFHGSLTH